MDMAAISFPFAIIQEQKACKLVTNLSPYALVRNIRLISWIKAARKDFEEFPEDVQSDMFDALTIAAEGGKSDKAKLFKGVDGGVFEIALRYRGDAFRALYTVKIGADLGDPHLSEEIEVRDQDTQMEIDLIPEWLKRLKEALE
jgi:hypothetical protein